MPKNALHPLPAMLIAAGLAIAPLSATASDIIITADGFEIGTGDMVTLATPTGQGTTLHAGPGAEHPVLMQIGEGDLIEFQRLQDGWALIWHMDSDTEGWVPGGALALPDEPGAPPQLVIEAPSPGWLPLHDGPGSEHAELRRLFSGMVVDHLDTQGEWLNIMLADGTTGWIPASSARALD